MSALSSSGRKFVLHWGRMGARWGINRPVAHVDAFLFLSPRPLPAEKIQQNLGVAGAHVSTSQWYSQFRLWPVSAVGRLARLGDKAFTLLKLTE